MNRASKKRPVKKKTELPSASSTARVLLIAQVADTVFFKQDHPGAKAIGEIMVNYQSTSACAQETCKKHGKGVAGRDSNNPKKSSKIRRVNKPLI